MRHTQHSILEPKRFIKSVVNRVNHIFFYKIKQLVNSRVAPVECIHFYPEYPHPYTVVYRTFHLLGITLKKSVPALNSKQIGFWWQDDTFVKDAPFPFLINSRCTDISKVKVGDLQLKIFGYYLRVDPLHYRGKMVIKSNINGAHDGVEVWGPCTEIVPNYVYQLVVDNRPNDELRDSGLVCDIRVTVFGGKASFIFLKYRPLSSRFSNTNVKVSIVDLHSQFTADEIGKINAYCWEIGLDYGEIDVVRDINDKRIYILDVNKTPLGPPNGLSAIDKARALELYKKEFVLWLSQLQQMS